MLINLLAVSGAGLSWGEGYRRKVLWAKQPLLLSDYLCLLPDASQIGLVDCYYLKGCDEAWTLT